MDLVVNPELVKILPSLLWVVFAFTVLYVFYQPIRDELLPKLASFEAGVVKMSFARESMDAAVELAQKSKKWPVVVPDADRERVLRRAQRCARVLAGAQALWVDDYPDNNVNEIRMFRQLKIAIDVATRCRVWRGVRMGRRWRRGVWTRRSSCGTWVWQLSHYAPLPVASPIVT